MKPLLIFQLDGSMKDTKMQKLANVIENGINYGNLIVDSSVTILSFDENGHMNYCTRHEGDT